MMRDMLCREMSFLRLAAPLPPLPLKLIDGKLAAAKAIQFDELG